jgi:hypothetical protein
MGKFRFNPVLLYPTRTDGLTLGTLPAQSSELHENGMREAKPPGDCAGTGWLVQARMTVIMSAKIRDLFILPLLKQQQSLDRLDTEITRSGKNEGGLL